MIRTPTDRPRAPACERNKAPILAVLQTVFARQSQVLEIGSGTGEHAVHFARHMPHLVWQTSDRAENHPGIHAWLDYAQLSNLRPPIDLDVTGAWPAQTYDAVFTANTLHIMGWPAVEAFFEGLGRVLESGARVAVYGPFHYEGRPTSESNAAFDASLKARDAAMGIRDFEAVDALARRQGLRLTADQGMPANNRCLVWRRD